MDQLHASCIYQILQKYRRRGVGSSPSISLFHLGEFLGSDLVPERRARSLRRQGAPSWLPDATVLFTVAGLAGIAVSITGNETAQRWVRRRVVMVAMSTAGAASLLTGWSASAPAVVAVLAIATAPMLLYLGCALLGLAAVI